MAKGKVNSKAAEKKKERIAMMKKMDARVALVKAANDQEDPLESLPSFKKFSKNDLDIELTTERVTSLDESTKTWLMDLLTRNMKELYEKSDWGWNHANKKTEMLEDNAWYLLARSSQGDLVAFAHFRYDMDYDDEVLYVYEIQIEDKARRKGLGRFMMQVLELLAFKADMRKIMLTAFKHNPQGQKFFREALKFEIDETCPIDDVYEQYDYQILSKFNKRKLAREPAPEAVKKERKFKPAPTCATGCCG